MDEIHDPAWPTTSFKPFREPEIGGVASPLLEMHLYSSLIRYPSMHSLHDSREAHLIHSEGQI